MPKCEIPSFHQQKIVLKLPLDDERKRSKAFKAAVGMNGKINPSN
jgi:hypothetical protein